MFHYPKIMQPTHVRWEQLDAPARRSSSQLYPTVDDSNSLPDGNDFQHDGVGTRDEANTIFPEPKSVFTRNFMIADTYYSGPPMTGLGIPGPDGDILDLGVGGLTDIPAHLLDELPADCLQALNEARAEEGKWKNSWSTESDDHARAHLRISYSGIS